MNANNPAKKPDAPRLALNRGAIVLIVLGILLGGFAWRLVGDELTRARVSSGAALRTWLDSGRPLADIALTSWSSLMSRETVACVTEKPCSRSACARSSCVSIFCMPILRVIIACRLDLTAIVLSPFFQHLCLGKLFAD